MSRPRRKFDPQFRDGAARIVEAAGRPVAHVAREPGVGEDTLGNWVRRDAAERAGGLTADERAERARLRTPTLAWLNHHSRVPGVIAIKPEALLEN